MLILTGRLLPKAGRLIRRLSSSAPQSHHSSFRPAFFRVTSHYITPLRRWGQTPVRPEAGNRTAAPARVM